MSSEEATPVADAVAAVASAAADIAAAGLAAALAPPPAPPAPPASAPAGVAAFPSPPAEHALPPITPNVMFGMSRAMSAMQAFYAAKSDYETSLAELAPGSAAYDAALAACHERSAAKALAVATANGGVYVKAAQFVASMQGGGGDAVVPPAFVRVLAALTDRAPYRSLAVVDAVLREELGADSAALFTAFSPEPIAAASLAQVHRAALADGTPVAVKVQYPELRQNLASDLAVFRTMGATVKPAGMDLTWMVADFEAFLAQEVDFRGEAANGAATAAALAHWGDAVLVPAVVPNLSTQRVLVTAFVPDLLRVDDPAALARAGLHRGAAGRLLAEVCAEMLLCHGRVHGDPHAGNVYLRALPPPTQPPTGLQAAREAAARALRRGSVAAAAAAPAVPGLASALVRVADACAGEGCSTLRRPQLVLLDHGLYHSLSEAQRLTLCRLHLACLAAHAPAMRAQAETLAGVPGSPLARFFPLVLSHWFVFSAGLLSVSPAELAAAAQGRLPPGLALADLGDFLAGLRGAQGGILGAIHSTGYTRGLLHALRFPERRRLRALAAAATRGLTRADGAAASLPAEAHPTAHRFAEALAAARVDLLALVLLPLLFVAVAALHAVDVAALLAFLVAAARVWAAHGRLG